MKDMKRKFALILAIVFMLSLSVAFAGREIRTYKNITVPGGGQRWYSPDTSKKAYEGRRAINNYGSTSGGNVRTCLVNGSYSAVTAEIEVAPGQEAYLSFKSGHGAEGKEYYLYMRSGVLSGNFRAYGSWSSDAETE